MRSGWGSWGWLARRRLRSDVTTLFHCLKEGCGQLGSASSPRQLTVGWGGLGWALRISSQKRWLDFGMGCPRRCHGLVDKVVLGKRLYSMLSEVFSNLFCDYTILGINGWWFKLPCYTYLALYRLSKAPMLVLEVPPWAPREPASCAATAPHPASARVRWPGDSNANTPVTCLSHSEYRSTALPPQTYTSQIFTAVLQYATFL